MDEDIFRSLLFGIFSGSLLGYLLYSNEGSIIFGILWGLFFFFVGFFSWIFIEDVIAGFYDTIFRLFKKDDD